MRITIINALTLGMILTACGGNEASSAEGRNPSERSSAKTVKGHIFKRPYVCERKVEKISKQTGKTRTRIFKSYYHPQLGWRLDDRSPSASLYTPDTRYDGVGIGSTGSKDIARMVGLTPQELEKAQYIFASAFPSTKPMPQISTANLSKYKKKDCKILDDTSVFDIGYLDKVEVMGK